MAKRGGWEMRRALRYGSELMGWASTLAKASAFARKDIENHESNGRITLIDRDNRIVYYDVFEEMS